MATISSLPEEVLRQLFSYIDSNLQLAQCRLVCSKWNDPANTAMFSNTIVFTTKEKAMTLYVQLFNRPSRGKLIQYIYFKKGFDTFWIVKAIFDAAPLPNLIQIGEESLLATELYTTLLDIIKNSPKAFSKLKALPPCEDTVTQDYCDVLRACRKTLSAIEIKNASVYLNDTMKALALELDTFDRLKSLTYWGRFQQIPDIELLLNGCIHLTKLALGLIMDGDVMEKQQLEVWMTTEVKKVKSLTQLIIYGQCRCDVLEYLLYKYPNIQTIKIWPNFYYHNIAKFKGNMDRVLQAIEGIPNKYMLFWLHKDAKLFEIAEFFLQKGYQFHIKKTQQSQCLQVEIKGL
ncbi:hypothetical protein MBANPS3_008166 [Mucor bainieri]